MRECASIGTPKCTRNTLCESPVQFATALPDDIDCGRRIPLLLIEERERTAYLRHGSSILSNSAERMDARPSHRSKKLVSQRAMLGGSPYRVLRDAIFTHPTAAEGLVYLFARAPAKAMQQPAHSLPASNYCDNHILSKSRRSSCAATVAIRNVFKPLKLALSEKQIPQVLENVENPT